MNTKQETIAQEALRLLEPVNPDIWITNFTTNEVCLCCAIGHYNRLKSDNPNYFGSDKLSDSMGLNISRPSVRLRDISNMYLRKTFNIEFDISTVNNRLVEIYNEPTPKERVIHLLTDMIKAGY